MRRQLEQDGNTLTRLHSARNVCARLDISSITLWRRVRNPELGFPQPVKISGRNYFRADDLEAWIAAQMARPT